MRKLLLGRFGWVGTFFSKLHIPRNGIWEIKHPWEWYLRESHIPGNGICGNHTSLGMVFGEITHPSKWYLGNTIPRDV